MREDRRLMAEVPRSDYMEPEDIARVECMEAIDKQVQPAAYDYSPRMQDRWIILHELTDPRNLQDPRAAVVRLEAVIEAGYVTTYSKYLGPTIGALNKYAYKLEQLQRKSVARPDDALSGESSADDGAAHTPVGATQVAHQPAGR